MGQFWQAALAVGGLGVVGAFVFYSLYKSWLKLPIFSKMTRRQTFTVILAFLGLTFLALIALLYTYLESKRSTGPSPDETKGIAHVRTSISRNVDELPVLDITLRNNSNSVAVITGAKVNVLDRWHIGPVWVAPNALPVSYTYDVAISGEIGKPQRIPLSQELRPKTADRFEIVLGSQDSPDWWYPAIGQFIFLIEVELTYNEDTSVVTLPTVFTDLPPPWEISGLYNPGPPQGALESLLNNAEEAKQAAERSGVVDEHTLKTLNMQIGEIQKVLKEGES